MGTRGSSSHSGAGLFGKLPSFPEFRKFATQNDAIDYHEKYNFDRSKWDALLTDEERQGIRYYTGSWYSQMNTALREGTYLGSSVQDLIDNATAGLSKWKAQDDVVTFRGANLHWTANLLEGTEEQMSNGAFLRSRIGKTVRDKGFMSSGTHENSSWSADVDYTIYVRKGTSGMYVDPISMHHGEYEFLFNRDTDFKVHAIKTDSSGKITELVLETVVGKKKKEQDKP